MYDYKPITITALAALLFVLALTSNSALASESGDISGCRSLLRSCFRWDGALLGLQRIRAVG